jgi:hypothetical protein
MNRQTETKRNLKYEFPDSEKLSMGKEMAELNRDINLLEDEKKAAMSSYKSRVDEKEARRTRLSNCIGDGFEFREIDCEIKYNNPKDGMKQVVRKDTQEVVEELSMTPEELQEELDFKEEKSKKAEEAKEAKRLKKLEKDNKRRQEKRQAIQKKKAEQKET